MISLRLREVADAVGGRLHRTNGDELITGAVEFDSRKLSEGSLFVALPGERVDGHDFAAAAIASGAVALLAAREVDAPAVIVPPVDSAHERALALAGDTDGSGAAVLAALAKLARFVVDRLAADGLTVVGITGSSGKTTSKDLIAQVLEPSGPTVAPPGSFNNEIGHPWTALRADESTKHLVLELSARGVGHIAELCAAAPPKIGVVLNVGTAHLGEFGSQEAVATAKGELPAALPAAADGGVAILNADDPLVAAMAGRTAAKVVTYGESAGAQVRAEDIRLDEQARPAFRLVTPEGSAETSLQLHGVYQVSNALAAAAVALAVGVPTPEIAKRLSAAQRRSAHRMAVSDRADGVTVINDAYNGIPEAVRAALKTLATMARASTPHRRTWAVLGPMGELGDSHVAVHDEIGRLAVRLDISRLVVVGEEARPMYQGAYLEGSWGKESVLVPDGEAAIALLRSELKPGDVVLVKASNAAGLWHVADAVLADPAGGAA